MTRARPVTEWTICKRVRRRKTAMISFLACFEPQRRAGRSGDGRRLRLGGFLFDTFRVFGNLNNPLVLLGFFQQPGFDCLGRGGPG